MRCRSSARPWSRWSWCRSGAWRQWKTSSSLGWHRSWSARPRCRWLCQSQPCRRCYPNKAARSPCQQTPAEPLPERPRGREGVKEETRNRRLETGNGEGGRRMVGTARRSGPRFPPRRGVCFRIQPTGHPLHPSPANSGPERLLDHHGNQKKRA